jgi:hypothetical protein
MKDETPWDSFVAHFGARADDVADKLGRGTTVLVPMTPTPFLLGKLGKEDAQELTWLMPKEYLYVRRWAGGSPRGRDLWERIFTEIEGGVSLEEICGRYQVSAPALWVHCQRWATKQQLRATFGAPLPELRQRRAQKMVHLRCAGYSLRAIARACYVDRSYVRKVLARHLRGQSPH